MDLNRCLYIAYTVYTIFFRLCRYIVVKLHKYNLKMCATKTQPRCGIHSAQSTCRQAYSFIHSYFGLNVHVYHLNSRIINNVSCVNSCKLDKYKYIFHTDNIGLDLNIGNKDYEIYSHIGIYM